MLPIGVAGRRLLPNQVGQLGETPAALDGGIVRRHQRLPTPKELFTSFQAPSCGSDEVVELSKGRVFFGRASRVIAVSLPYRSGKQPKGFLAGATHGTIPFVRLLPQNIIPAPHSLHIYFETISALRRTCHCLLQYVARCYTLKQTLTVTPLNGTISVHGILDRHLRSISRSRPS